MRVCVCVCACMFARERLTVPVSCLSPPPSHSRPCSPHSLLRCLRRSVETLHRSSSLAARKQSVFSEPAPLKVTVLPTTQQQQQQMDFELRGSLFSLYYRWRAARSLSVNGIKWHRLLLLFPMILFPCGPPEATQEGLVGCQC